jgi:fatty acid/phospholipid biosynthesis enzyme
MAARPKYGPLHDWLNRQPTKIARVECTFAQIEEMIGEPLPPTARSQKRYQMWWSNATNHHIQAQAWVSAGWKREHVDLAAEIVTFVRTIERPGTGAT